MEPTNRTSVMHKMTAIEIVTQTNLQETIISSHYVFHVQNTDRRYCSLASLRARDTPPLMPP